MNGFVVPSAKAVFDAIENSKSIPVVEDLNTFVPTTTIADDYTCVVGIITSNTLNKNNFENYFVCTYLYYDGDDSYEIYQYVYASANEYYDRYGYGNSIQGAIEYLATDSFTMRDVLIKDAIKKTSEFDSYKNLDGAIPSCKAVTDHFIEQSNRVTSMSSTSTDTQIPSAKCVYDAIQNSITLPIVEDLNTFFPTLSDGEEFAMIEGIMTPSTLNKLEDTLYGFVSSCVEYTQGIDGEDDDYYVYQSFNFSSSGYYERVGESTTYQGAINDLILDDYDLYHNLDTSRLATDYSSFNKNVHYDVPSTKLAYDTFVAKSSVTYTSDTTTNPQNNGDVVWYIEEA